MSAYNINETLIMRDPAGSFYLLTPTILAMAKASPEQQAELAYSKRDDTAGFLINIRPIDFGFTLVRPVGGEKELVEAGSGGGARRTAADGGAQPAESGSTGAVRREVG
jgi:hypothetical protein